MRADFSHLHTHTIYSLLDGMAQIEELMIKAKDLGQRAIAITDHGSSSGLYEAYKVSKKVGIKLIAGIEFYYERESDGKNGHLIVLAKNNKGLENIYQLQKYACTENFYRKPRIDFKTLKKYKEGLVVTSACLASTLCQYLLEGSESSAIEWASKFKEEFGDDFYIEIQPNSIIEQIDVNRKLISIAKKLDIKVIATNDIHYVDKGDSEHHEALLAMQSKTTLSDPKRFKFDTEDFWLKSKEEMREGLNYLPEHDVFDALNNTGEIVDKCNVEFKYSKMLPKFYNLNGKSPRDMMVDEIKKGVSNNKKIVNKEYLREVQNEIDIIDEEGYCDYFLIVQDYVKSARSRGEVVGDGRGSASGSKVSFLMDITRVEPKKYNLLFERFMSKGRTPDIDTDFSNQDNVFTDLQSKYGKHNVARIATFGRLTPKSVTRKVLSVYGFSQKDINIISKSISVSSKDIREEAKTNHLVRTLKLEHPKVFQSIVKLQNGISHEGKHAGGIVIFPEIYKYLPVKTTGEDRDSLIVAFDKDEIEELGFYKFDVLGLETTSVIEKALEIIKNTTGEELNLHSVDYDDKNVYDMLSSGDVSGVFQLSNQRDKVMRQKPSCFNDLVAISAIIRPGVADFEQYIRRRINEEEWSINKKREWYLGETYGLTIYQEQYLLDANTFAGWDLAFADKNIRKNKRLNEDVDLREKFIKDSIKNGFNEDEVIEVWNEMVKIVSQGYGFNKSHAVSYSIISFQSAYLKYYYPMQYYSALMSMEDTSGEGQVKIGKYIGECINKGVKILPPDINNGSSEFLITKEGISYKLSSITFVGDQAIDYLKTIRPIKSLDDLLERSEKKHMKVNVIKNLIKAGCFDFENPNRLELLRELSEKRSNKKLKEELDGLEYNDDLKLIWEKESLGLYLTGHPMEKYGFYDFESYENDEYDVLQGGEVEDVSVIYDKNGNKMAFATLNTLFGIVKTVIFSSSFDKFKDLLEKGNLVMVKGKKSEDSLLVSSMEILN